jgi:hypothetical protein
MSQPKAGPTGPEVHNSNDLIPSLAFTISLGSTPQGVLPKSVSGRFGVAVLLCCYFRKSLRPATILNNTPHPALSPKGRGKAYSERRVRR